MLVLTTAAARALDRAAQERFGIPGIVLMENAAIGMSAIALEMLRDAEARRVVVVCGPGNNGGDGYAIARHLANERCDVTLVPIGAPRDGTDAAVNAAIARAMGIKSATTAALTDPPDLVVDALFGSGLDRYVSGEPLEAIRAINVATDRGARVLAVDIPSGLDADSGAALGDAVRATLTAVTVAPRPACFVERARAFIGSWRVVGIGCPARLVEDLATQR